MQARYKVNLDPTVDEVKKLATSCRKNAKTERVLFHYNGHGVPKPTANGEIWLFNKVCSLVLVKCGAWLGKPMGSTPLTKGTWPNRGAL